MLVTEAAKTQPGTPTTLWEVDYGAACRFDGHCYQKIPHNDSISSYPDMCSAIDLETGVGRAIEGGTTVDLLDLQVNPVGWVPSEIIATGGAMAASAQAAAPAPAAAPRKPGEGGMGW